ncbi:MAG: 30S ribosomal protein S18 [Actinomycetota bacterium]|nr:30S ribosomal protein S18 [Actinomycetota bacterium]
MARDRRSNRKPPKKTTVRKGKKKYCQFCADKAKYVDYKDIAMLRKYMSERGKIRARRVTGNCPQHQRMVATAVKNAREMALLPFASRETAERGHGHGRGRDRDRDR